MGGRDNPLRPQELRRQEHHPPRKRAGPRQLQFRQQGLGRPRHIRHLGAVPRRRLPVEPRPQHRDRPRQLSEPHLRRLQAQQALLGASGLGRWRPDRALLPGPLPRAHERRALRVELFRGHAAGGERGVRVPLGPRGDGAGYLRTPRLHDATAVLRGSLPRTHERGAMRVELLPGYPAGAQCGMRVPAGPRGNGSRPVRAPRLHGAAADATGRLHPL